MSRFGTPASRAFALLLCRFPMKCHSISSGS
uniref:Cl14781_1 n=1 Tax=Arundo donax TaxID=35708 RepID=A0A0A8XSD8_ARUDO